MNYYAPGFKAGGPVRSVTRLVDRLRDEMGFVVVTRDRDLGEREPYFPGCGTAWSSVGGTPALYVAPEDLVLARWCRLLSQIPHDVVYLNGLFAKTSRLTLWGRRLGLLPPRPVVVAPRGEFSAGALGLKSLKKRAYFIAARIAGVHRSVIWQASNPAERAEIISGIRAAGGVADDIHVAPNVAGSVPEAVADRPKEAGRARLVFLSRISPMKNLAFAISVVALSPSPIELDIIGPIEDAAHWNACLELVNRLPGHVRVRYLGNLAPDAVPLALSQYDALILPTLGESFGHVIVEAMSAGCLPMISDRTPWRGLREQRAGWDLPLEKERFAAAIAELVDMDGAEFREWSLRALELGRRHERDADAVAAHRTMFMHVLAQVEGAWTR